MHILHNAWTTYEGEAVAGLSARFHHRLVLIHPFPNGNGRHARLATDLLLVRLDQPRFSWGRANLVNVSETRQAYATALWAADARDIGPLLKFVRTHFVGRIFPYLSPTLCGAFLVPLSPDLVGRQGAQIDPIALDRRGLPSCPLALPVCRR